MLWTAKIEVPKNGAKCEIPSDELMLNQDPKPPKH